MYPLLDSISHRYTRQGLWSLFLVCAFPIHLWTLILFFRDMDWLIERTNVWDAIGAGSYGLVFALVESLILFGGVALLGFLTPKAWDADRRIAFLSLLVLILGAWAMISQLRYLLHLSLPLPVIQFLAASKHPFRFLVAMYLAVVVPTVLGPVALFLRSGKSVKWMQELTERLSTLTMFYLAFDVVGLIIVVIRNFS